jgi:hypothetical protein
MARMRPLARVQWIVAVLFFGSAISVCQSTLPPMAPTVREIEEQPANVEYADGQVAVLAENSSLSEIIRDVARRAGMAVKGSVVDERVFGKYGPAAPSEVLTKLLQGTGSNMLVLAGTSHVPQLILTPKQGGPTPPRTLAEIAEVAGTEAEGDRGSNVEDAHPVKMSQAEEQPAQASAESDGAGLSQDKVNGDPSDVQPDAKPATDPDPQSSAQPTTETGAQ